MALMSNDAFICLDCETTGLEPSKHQIIEVAVALFTFKEILKEYETLIDPGCPISEESMAIHHITSDMVAGKPKIEAVLPTILQLVDKHIIIGHGIALDIAFLSEAAKQRQIPCNLSERTTIDTLRMARLYGESPTNSLETLRRHFNIAAEGAHRAMNDVRVNIEVFKYLCKKFKTTAQLLERLKQPIQLKAMPLGKYKGRPFSEVPLEYLRWAARQEFDQDLLFSIRSELKKRRGGEQFSQSTNPFSQL